MSELAVVGRKSTVCGVKAVAGSATCDRATDHRGRHWDRTTEPGRRFEWGGSGPGGRSKPQNEREGERLEVRLGDEASRCLTLLVQRVGGTRRSHVETAIVARYLALVLTIVRRK